MKERRVSFEEALHSAVRNGLMKTKQRKKRFIQETAPLGEDQTFVREKALAAADAIEDEERSLKRNPREPQEPSDQSQI